MLLYTYPENFRAFKALIAAQFSGANVKVAPNFEFGVTNKSEAFLKKFPLGKVSNYFRIPCLAFTFGLKKPSKINKSRLRLAVVEICSSAVCDDVESYFWHVSEGTEKCSILKPNIDLCPRVMSYLDR